MGDCSQSRFECRTQIQVFVKSAGSQKRTFSHVDIVSIDGVSMFKCAKTNKRRLTHIIQEGCIENTIAEITRRRDGLIDELIKQSLFDSDPMQDYANIDISSMSASTRKAKFEKANIPAVMSITCDGPNPHTMRVASTPVSRGALVFEMTPDNLEWIAEAIKTDWGNQDDASCSTLDKVYRYVDLDWDQIQARVIKGDRLQLRCVNTFVRDGKRVQRRLLVPRHVSNAFLSSEQEAADKIADMGKKLMSDEAFAEEYEAEEFVRAELSIYQNLES